MSRCPATAPASCGSTARQSAARPATLPAETLWFLVGDRGCLADGDWMAGPCVITGPADDNGELQPVPSSPSSTPPPRRHRDHRPAPVAASRSTPLENWLNTRYHNLSASADRQCGGRLSTGRIAELVGFTRQAVHRWRADGVPLWSADRAATNAGAHPLELWPDFHADLADRGQSGGTA